MSPRPVPFLAVLALLLTVGWLAGRSWSDPPPVMPVRCVNPSPRVCPR